jgi:hypothetical protein
MVAKRAWQEASAAAAARTADVYVAAGVRGVQGQDPCGRATQLPVIEDRSHASPIHNASRCFCCIMLDLRQEPFQLL